MEPSHYEVIVANGTNGKMAVGVSFQSEADALADIFANSKTSVDVRPIYMDDFRQAAESIAKFLKGLF